jgi:hypothetical protein
MLYNNTLYELYHIEYFYLTLGIFAILFLFKIMLKNLDKITNLIVLHPQIVNKIEIGSISKFKKIDLNYYTVLYNVYKIIGSSIGIDKSDIFDDEYLFKLNEAKKLYYDIKRNKSLVKSNYLLIKIFNKIRTYGINKNELDDTVIYLIMLVFNKNKRQITD